MIGSGAGKNYSGVATENLITATNCYYLSGTVDQGDGYSASTTGITAKTAEEMKASEFVQDLSDAFLFQDGGYPMLNWQNPDTEYTVSFTLSPSSAQLTVKDSSQTVVQPVSGATYQLKNGDYTYEVSADEYVPQSGSFTVAYGGQTISISLAIKNYDYVFTTVPTDAVLTVEGQNPLADGRTYQLSKAQNPYRYSVQAFGYDAENGVFSVSGETDADRKTVTLHPAGQTECAFWPDHRS